MSELTCVGRDSRPEPTASWHPYPHPTLTTLRFPRRRLRALRFPKLRLCRKCFGSVGRWRAPPGVEIHVDTLRDARVIFPAPPGPHVAMRIGWLPELFIISGTRFYAGLGFLEGSSDLLVFFFYILTNVRLELSLFRHVSCTLRSQMTSRTCSATWA